MNEPIIWPTRQVTLTFRHETCGDRLFAPMVNAAFLERQAVLAAQPKAFEPGSENAIGDMDDFRASNGVLVQVSVPEMEFPIEQMVDVTTCSSTR